MSGSRRPARTPCSWRKRRSLGCSGSGRSPISSRNSVPPSAAATFPSVAATAPVNAPLTWPNSSLSSSSAPRLGQLTVTNGPERPPAPGMDRPSQDPLARPALSPDQHHGIGRRDLPPLPEHGPYPRVLALHRDLGDFRASRASRSSTRLQSPCIRPRRSSTPRTWAGVNGLGRKSNAPRRIASTAASILPCAVMITIAVEAIVAGSPASHPARNRGRGGDRSGPHRTALAQPTRVPRRRPQPPRSRAPSPPARPCNRADVPFVVNDQDTHGQRPAANGRILSFHSPARPTGSKPPAQARTGVMTLPSTSVRRKSRPA